LPIALDTIPADPDLPERADVVVIGGGIVGIASALYLARAGISVVVCEKGEVGGEQSGRNWGWVRVMGRDPGEIPLALDSQRMWEDLARSIGPALGFRRSGIVYVADTERDLKSHEEWLGHARDYQLDSRLLTPREIEQVLPGSRRRYAGALFTPGDARAEPSRAVPAIALALRQAGGRVLTGCAVRGIETEGGRLSAVVTEKGPIRCGQAVLAGGAWSRLFLGNMGIDFPQLKILGSVLRTEPLDGPPEHAVGGTNFAFRKRADGGYTVANRGASVAHVTPDSFRLFADFAPSLLRQRHELRLRPVGRFLEEARTRRRWKLDEATPFEAVRMLDPAPDEAILREGVANLKAAFPAFEGLKVAASWGGLVDATPDAVPVIGEVPRLPGFFIASGFSGHGFGIGPGAGRLVADLLTGRSSAVDARPFRLERFDRLRRTTARAA
jgi:glycine/D-amino acid oxidase-like deaminating enzyme